jgi:hypothetical protein
MARSATSDYGLGYGLDQRAIDAAMALRPPGVWGPVDVLVEVAVEFASVILHMITFSVLVSLVSVALAIGMASCWRTSFAPSAGALMLVAALSQMAVDDFLPERNRIRRIRVRGRPSDGLFRACG